jgi:hypothetical protein
MGNVQRHAYGQQASTDYSVNRAMGEVTTAVRKIDSSLDEGTSIGI